jgi:MFS family permease
MNRPSSLASLRSREWSYGLAVLGAHIAFMPLLVLLLPRRVEVLAEGDAAIALSRLLLVGAVTASAANIAAGAASDRWMRKAGNRRVPLGIGMASTLASYGWLAGADSLSTLTAAVILFQVSVNAMLSPLFAILPDHFTSDQKGRIAGIANAALPLSSAVVAPLVWLFPRDDSGAFLLTGAAAVCLCLPLLIAWPFAQGVSPATVGDRSAAIPHKSRQRDFTLAWLARFLVQLGAAFVIGYLYVVVSSQVGLPGREGATEVARQLAVLAIAATLVAMLASLTCGWLSDRFGTRRWPLAAAAILTGGSLAVLAATPGWFIFLAAYALFHAGLAGFLAVDTALVAEMLAAHPRRAALLGLMNLTNTLPGIVAPGIALLMLQQDQDVAALISAFALGSVGCGLAAIAVLCIRSVR